jgi:hypothetical protein
MKFKKLLYLSHRWLGIAICLFLLMWPVTGIVMMYVGFPSLTSQERLASLPNLNAQTVLVAPSPLIEAIGADSVDSLRLTTILTRPAYLLKTKEGKFHSIFADTGEKIPAITPDRAALAAQSFYHHAQTNSSSEPTSALNAKPSIAQENVIVDQWSVSSSLNLHRPLHKIALNDVEDTHLYVSTASGEVVRDTTKHERVWNWLGANLHWIYPFQLRQHASVWHWVIVVLSSWGVLSVLTGGTIGLMRLRLRKRYRGKDITPYRGINKIHHTLGLVCVVFLFTYMTSGLLSVNPFGVFSSNASCQISESVYAGNLQKNSIELHRDNIHQLIKNNNDLKEIRFYWVADRVYPIGITLNTRKLLKDNVQQPLRVLVDHAVRKASIHCDVNNAIIQTSKLDAFDHYYYSHHGSNRPLPVYKIELNDKEKTWIYINAHTGEWIFSKTSKQRIQRWLYNGLHSLDFLLLTERRPLWDFTVITLCLLAAVMAFSSMVIAFKRLRIKLPII